MPAPLTNRQKAYLAQLCRRAFNRQAALAHGRGDAWEIDEEQWRHDQVARATGKLGLRCCSQLDYKAVESAFLDLAGEHGRAFDAAVRAQTERHRQAEAKLLENLRAYGFDPTYAEPICRNMFKCSVLEATTEQLWKLCFTIRTRGGARRRAEKGNQCK